MLPSILVSTRAIFLLLWRQKTFFGVLLDMKAGFWSKLIFSSFFFSLRSWSRAALGTWWRIRLPWRMSASWMYFWLRRITWRNLFWMGSPLSRWQAFCFLAPFFLHNFYLGPAWGSVVPLPSWRQNSAYVLRKWTFPGVGTPIVRVRGEPNRIGLVAVEVNPEFPLRCGTHKWLPRFGRWNKTTQRKKNSTD